jgi:hypothetical protein
MPSPSISHATVATVAGGAVPRTAYQATPACSDRSQRCANRNGVWPPLYKRQWNPHPARSLDKFAQQRFVRCVLDAVADGELHRTTGNVLLAFARASDDRLSDPWIAQATVAARLGLGESTVCHHVATAKRLGWVVVQHRNRIDNGMVRAMSNVTRLQLPQPWHDRLAAHQAERRAEQTRQRRQRNPHGRVTAPKAGERRASGPGSEQGPVYATAAQQAASAGVAQARSASTTTFEQGRAELEAAYPGQPDLYEAAYDAFVEMWKTVRINE